MADKILILDFGSQYSQLITRKIREHNVFSELVKYDTKPPESPDPDLKGIILSGGPSSIHDKDAPQLDPQWLKLDVPVLGICYGLYLITDLLGGKVKRSRNREYGRATLNLPRSKSSSLLLQGLPKKSQTWMSHGDSVIKLAPGFKCIGSTDSLKYAALENRSKNLFAVQFHPEVAHTEFGKTVLSNFIFDICNARANWTPASYVKSEVARLKNQLGNQKVLCALSGGVDSSVTAMLLHRAIGKKLVCVFINNGLLRLNEADEVKKSVLK